MSFFREIPPATEFSPDALVGMQDAVDALSGGSAYEREHALTEIFSLRPYIEVTLANERAMPDMLDVMTKLSTAGETLRINRDTAREAEHAAAQMVGIHHKAIESISIRDDAVGDQALALLYDAASRLLLHNEAVDFLIDRGNLQRMSNLDAAGGHLSSYRSAKYQALAIAIAQQATFDQLTDFMNSIDELLMHDQTHEIGLIMRRRLAEQYALHVTSPTNVEEDSLGDSASFAFGICIKKCLDRTLISGEVGDELHTLIKQAEVQGLNDELWAAALDSISRPFAISFISERLATHTLAHYGIAFSDLQDAWRVGASKRADLAYSFDRYTRENLKVIRELEATEPGSAATLMREFGIRNFSRYPVRMLIRQYRERNNKELDYGVLVYALNDHNTALEGGWNIPGLLDLDRQIEELGAHIRIYECDSRNTVLRALLDARNRYERKLAFGVAVVHGSEQSMSFEDMDQQNMGITTDCVKRFRHSDYASANRLADLFSPGATGTLNSCRTGVFGGIGEAVAEILQIPISAPLLPVSEFRPKARRRGKGIEITMEYTNTEARICLPRSVIGIDYIYEE